MWCRVFWRDLTSAIFVCTVGSGLFAYPWLPCNARKQNSATFSALDYPEMCFHAISTQWEVIEGNLVHTPLQALHTVESPPKKGRLRPAR